jgi:hypothetical protein
MHTHTHMHTYATATSALDSTSERVVQEALDNLSNKIHIIKYLYNGNNPYHPF